MYRHCAAYVTVDAPRAEPTLKLITFLSAVMSSSHLNSEVSHPCPPSPLIIVDINLALPQGPDGSHSRLWIVPALSSNKSSLGNVSHYYTRTSFPRQQWPSKCYQPLHCCEAQQCLLKLSRSTHSFLYAFHLAWGSSGPFKRCFRPKEF